MKPSDEILREYGYSNFKSLAEEWSEYIIEDGSLLRIKTIPLKFIKKEQEYAMNGTRNLVIFTPTSLRGPPSDELIDDSKIRKSLEKIDMKFEPLKEPWNEYQLEDGIKVFLKTVVTSISKTNLYDNYGEPVYLVQHQPLTKRYPI